MEQVSSKRWRWVAVAATVEPHMQDALLPRRVSLLLSEVSWQTSNERKGTNNVVLLSFYSKKF